MANSLGVSASTTHDLWVEARKFKISLSRPTHDTIQLSITRPKDLRVVDGAVVLLSTKPIVSVAYPRDGDQYRDSTNWFKPEDKTDEQTYVVASYYGISNKPMPVSDTDEEGVDSESDSYTFTVTVTNTDPSQIYYASIHASTNVIQYYPIGIQSYPLESALLEKAVSGYAGNIPSLPVAPTSPSHGYVYHDQQLNITQFWDGNRKVWIPTRSDMIVSGTYNPGTLGQTYLLSGLTLFIFDGTNWVKATPENLQVKTATGWTPFVKSISRTSVPVDIEAGTFIFNFTTQRYTYWDGTQEVFPSTTNTLLVLADGNMAPCFIAPPTVEPTELKAPALGELFYNTTAKSLNVWDGKIWIKANTDQEGTPLTDKFTIGNDGSYNERIRLVKIIAGQMGWPVQCVELKEEQFNIAIDNAIENYRQLSDGAYRRSFMLYKLIPNQQTYFLNSAIDQTDSIVDVHKIHRVGPMGGIYGGGQNDIWATAFAQQFYNLTAGTGDMISTTLIAQYGEDLTRMFAGDLMFQWNEASRELYITRAIRNYETVVIECMTERTEQELLTDRWCKQFIQNWALAEVKMMLGMIRSKFSSGTPGPSGSITLNGELLIAEARQDFIELKESLLNYEYGAMINTGNCSFLIG